MALSHTLAIPISSVMTPGPQLPAPSRLIETEIGNPPADRTPVSRQGLPEDLLQEAAHRLGVVCLVSGGLWLANFIAVHLIHPMPGTLRAEQLALHPQWMRVFDVVGGAGFLASLGLFWYTRRTTRGPRFLLDLALCYEVFIALNIGILDYAVGYPAGVSWIAIIILLFPPVIPSTPRKTLIAALIAASKKPSARPATARELCDRLAQCEVEPWTREDARRWWETRLEPETAVTFSD
jgi:hypothetical protein